MPFAALRMMAIDRLSQALARASARLAAAQDTNAELQDELRTLVGESGGPFSPEVVSESLSPPSSADDSPSPPTRRRVLLSPGSGGSTSPASSRSPSPRDHSADVSSEDSSHSGTHMADAAEKVLITCGDKQDQWVPTTVHVTRANTDAELVQARQHLHAAEATLCTCEKRNIALRQLLANQKTVSVAVSTVSEGTSITPAPAAGLSLSPSERPEIARDDGPKEHLIWLRLRDGVGSLPDGEDDAGELLWHAFGLRLAQVTFSRTV